MSITNTTGFVLDLSQIFVAWNENGAQNATGLFLAKGDLGGSFWTGNEQNSPQVFVPGSSFSMPTIPKGTSTITFTFIKNYEIRNYTEAIVITIGTNGCNGYTLTGN